MQCVLIVWALLYVFSNARFVVTEYKLGAHFGGDQIVFYIPSPEKNETYRSGDTQFACLARCRRHCLLCFVDLPPQPISDASWSHRPHWAWMFWAPVVSCLSADSWAGVSFWVFVAGVEGADYAGDHVLKINCCLLDSRKVLLLVPYVATQTPQHAHTTDKHILYDHLRVSL